MLQPGQEVDRFVVVRRLGQGGMADVYLVKHASLGSLYALKVLSSPLRSVADRMRQEGRVQATLRHPNVVGVHDVLTIGGAPALLMEYVDGPSLDRLLPVWRPTEREALDVFAGILAGVGAAHAKGVIHRDLKPANVMLQVDAGGAVVKVADFGLAKALIDGGGTTRTRSGATMGTPAYMAPEQIRDASRVDARADLFSLGCVLYELVTGHRAFPNEDVIALFGDIAAGRYEDPRRHGPCSEPVREAIAACLRGDPAARVPDCDALTRLLAPAGFAARPGHGFEPDARVIGVVRQLPAGDPDRSSAPSSIARSHAPARAGQTTPFSAFGEEGAASRPATPHATAGEPTVRRPSAPAPGESGVGTVVIAPPATTSATRSTSGNAAVAAGFFVTMLSALVFVAVVGTLGVVAISQGGLFRAPETPAIPEAPLPLTGVKVLDPDALPSGVGVAVPEPPPTAPPEAAKPASSADNPKLRSLRLPETPPKVDAPLVPVVPPEKEPASVTLPGSGDAPSTVKVSRLEPARPAGPSGPTLTISGDTTDVVLRPALGADIRPPGPVPAGTYTIIARFSGEPVPAGKITVPEGVASVNVSCRADMTRCVAKVVP